MLRKRTRSVQKEQQQISDCGSESSFQSDGDGGNKNPKNNSFYTTIPGLLVGWSPKGLALADCDSVKSPTSPLDFILFSGLGNPYRPSSSSSSSTTTATARSSSSSSSSFGGSKLGLISIIDSHDDDDGDCGMTFSGKALSSPPSESSKNIIVFGPKLRVVKSPTNGHQNENTHNPFGSSSPKSLPKNYAIFPHPSKPKSPLQKGSSDVLFEIGDGSLGESFGRTRSCSLDSCRTISNLSGLRANLNNNPNSSSIDFSLEDYNNNNTNNTNNNVSAQVSSPRFIVGSPNSNQLSGNGCFIGSLSASEIELSEDYTCVISHGPNPKTTHIFGDCILETHSNDLSKEAKLSNPIITITNTNSEASSLRYPSDGFLTFCYSCNKKLEDDKDIYIYRGEKAFCSLNCRSLEILMDEELEKSSEDSLSPDGDDDDQDDCNELFFEPGLIAAR